MDGDILSEEVNGISMRDASNRLAEYQFILGRSVSFGEMKIGKLESDSEVSMRLWLLSLKDKSVVRLEIKLSESICKIMYSFPGKVGSVDKELAQDFSLMAEGYKVPPT